MGRFFELKKVNYGCSNQPDFKENNAAGVRKNAGIFVKEGWIDARKNLNRIKSASGYGRRDKNRIFKSKDVLGVMIRDNQKPT